MPHQGLRNYYKTKLEELDVILRLKEQNVRRLEAQRNDWNEKGILAIGYHANCSPQSVRFIKEELMRLQEPGSHVGEVVKLMGKKKALVKVGPEGKYVVNINPKIDICSMFPSIIFLTSSIVEG